jgi:hypothetical protein
MPARARSKAKALRTTATRHLDRGCCREFSLMEDCAKKNQRGGRLAHNASSGKFVSVLTDFVIRWGQLIEWGKRLPVFSGAKPE